MKLLKKRGSALLGGKSASITGYKSPAIDQSNFLTCCSCRDLRQNCANSDAKNGCVIIKRGGKAQKQPFTLAMAVEAILCDKRKFCKVKTQTPETRGGGTFYP